VTYLASIGGVSGDISKLAAAAACGVFVTMALPAVIPLLRRAAVVDVPSDRSSHTVPTPRGGGAPIAVGLSAAALAVHSAPALAFTLGVAAFGAIGLADDLLGLPARRRLMTQGVMSLAVAAVLVQRLSLPPAGLTVAAVAVALWLVGFVNAFNFMDGVNGISAAHAVVGGSLFCWLGTRFHDPFLLVVGAAIAAGALAFLPWNAVRARVFLGDVGSYALGMALGTLAIYAVIRGVPPEAAIAPLALYLADTAWTLQRRVRAGEPWLEAHRTHTYQRLCDLGWSHQRVTAATTALTTALCLLGAVSMAGRPALRAAADAAGLMLLATYLRAPALLGGALRTRTA
jgi:UDP-GlcNAc:undecaprenyl-phosphate GlcNAc-1-phosphate transferase